MSWIWLLIGCFVGFAIWFSQRISVVKLPEKGVQAAKRTVLLGAVLRWTLTAVVLAAAVQQGLGVSLSAFAGLMSARWLGILSLRVFPLRNQRKLSRM